jgi:hypothetical protein
MENGGPALKQRERSVFVIFGTSMMILAIKNATDTCSKAEKAPSY